MADVRLTATNPEDSSVVPVACNAKGELKLEEPILVEGPPGAKGDKGDPGDPFTGNFAGDVTFDGNQYFSGKNMSFTGYSYTTTQGERLQVGWMSAAILHLDCPSDHENQNIDSGWASIKIKSSSLLETTKLYADGSVVFAGAKAGFTKEGYLFCTTRRGDTVVLDATSNGMGIWEPYEPGVLRDELNELLDRD